MDGRGGRVSIRSAVHEAAALAGCRRALIGTGAQEPLLFPCRCTISGFVGSFPSAGALAGWRALTIESSVMSGCDWGHEPKEIVSKKL